MYTLLCDVICFAYAQVIQAALKNTLLLRHTWREVLHGRLHFGKVPFDRGAESTIAGYPNVLSQACLPRLFITTCRSKSISHCECSSELRLPLLCTRFAFASPSICFCIAVALPSLFLSVGGAPLSYKARLKRLQDLMYIDKPYLFRGISRSARTY